MTKYPNLLAEYKAGNGGHICTFCDHANVTEELMKAIFYDGEDLLANEALALCRLLGCNVNYLLSPKLSVLNPQSNKWKRKFHALNSFYNNIVNVAEEKDLSRFHTDCLYGATDVICMIDTDKPVTYAEYRKAVRGLRLVRDVLIEAARRPRDMQRKVVVSV